MTAPASPPVAVGVDDLADRYSETRAPDKEDIAWLQRVFLFEIGNGHCGESTSDMIDRQRARARSRRIMNALASPVSGDGSSADADTHPAPPPPVVGWQTMENAPKDRPILGWCVHDADPYFIEPEDGSGRSRLTLYGGHTEGLSHVSDGPHVIEWGGAWDDRSHEYDGGWMPDWWFRSDSEFEVTANPVLWMDIEPPAASVSPGMETLQASECTKEGDQ